MEYNIKGPLWDRSWRKTTRFVFFESAWLVMQHPPDFKKGQLSSKTLWKVQKNASLHLQPVFFSWILSQQVVCLCRRVVLKSGWIHEWGFVNCNFHPSQRFEFPTVWQPSYWRKHHAWPALPHRSLFDSQENYRRPNGCKDLLFCEAYFIPVEYFQETFITKLL